MIYEYECCHCEHRFDVVKPLAEIDKQEFCDQCGVLGRRMISRSMLSGVGDWLEEYNPAFGCVVKSKQHQREILAKFKDNGKEMIEIGNEPLEKIHKKCDSQREERRKERRNEPTAKIIQEVLG